MTLLSIIAPCYNEEESLAAFFAALERVREQLPLELEYLFINDGSTDGTLDLLRKFQSAHADRVHYISFSRNFGKEAAMFAGLQAAKGDYVAVMDADLQDPPELLLEMYEKIRREDVDCVAARREDRTGESLLVSLFSRIFYKIMNKISVTPVVDGVRDFRLMTRQMVDAILELTEYNRFSKGLFTWVGFHTEYIAYKNVERKYGKTKWGFFSRVSYAMEGMVNFSQAPLDFAVYVGMGMILVDVIAILFLIIRAMFWRDPVGGYASTMVVLLFSFGMTNVVLGIVGKYTAKIFLEAKKRPIYIVKEKR